MEKPGSAACAPGGEINSMLLVPNSVDAVKVENVQLKIIRRNTVFSESGLQSTTLVKSPSFAVVRARSKRQEHSVLPLPSALLSVTPAAYSSVESSCCSLRCSPLPVHVGTA